MGAGKLAPRLIHAHAAMNPVENVIVWNRNRAGAERLAAELENDAFSVEVTDDRAAAVFGADIISAATISTKPLVEGAWLKPGSHVDLVGAYAPHLRESDDRAIERATLFVDTFDGALKEGGDLVQPMRAGLISCSDVKADLAMLCRGNHPGRTADDEITLFKSTGAALADFAVGCLIWRRHNQDSSCPPTTSPNFAKNWPASFFEVESINRDPS